jgi:hypothetical protein
MSMRLLRRSLLYFFSVCFLVFGLIGLFAPAMLIAELHLRPITLAGLGELRGVYGGGFFAFGLVILAGLRSKTNSSGLLLAMCIIFTCIALGRLFSILFELDFAYAAQTAIPEIIMAVCCYYESRPGLARA